MEETERASDAGPRWTEVTIPIDEIVARVGWWLVGIGALIYLPLAWSWGVPNIPAWPWPAVWLGELAGSIAVLLAAYVVSVPVHEGLHAAGMLLTGTRMADIKFGVRLRQGIVYAHCATPMRLSAYRIVLMAPVLVTGLVPAVWSLLAGNWWVAAYAYLMTVSAAGDLEMAWRLRSWNGDAWVRDHPSMLGCEVTTDRLSPDSH